MKKIKNTIVLLICLFAGICNVKATNVAKIGSTEYATFNQAYDAASDNDTIELLADTDITRGTSKPIAKDITINIKSFKLSDSYVGGINISGNVNIIGDGTNATINTAIKIKEDAKLTIKNVKDTFESSIIGAIVNKGTLVVENCDFNLSGYNNAIDNEADAVATFNSGNINAYSLFKNSGTLTINGGSFTSRSNSNNSGELIINNGTFNLSDPIKNNAGTLTINNGTFTGVSIAENYDAGASALDDDYKNKSIINIKGGSFNTTDILLSNAALSSYSEINVYGGTLKTTVGNAKYALGCYNDTNNLINIYGGTIEAENSKGIFLMGACSITIGKDDGNVSTTSPIIKINKGGIEQLGVEAKIYFYDGKFFISKNIDDEAEMFIPEGYTVKYEKQSDNSYIAYLVKDEENSTNSKTNSKTDTKTDIKSNNTEITNPATGINILAGFILIVAMVVTLLIRKKKTLNNYN